MDRQSFDAIQGMLKVANMLVSGEQTTGIEAEVGTFIQDMANQLISGNGVYDSCDDPGAVRVAEKIAQAYAEKMRA
jgi:hypothetical protein